VVYVVGKGDFLKANFDGPFAIFMHFYPAIWGICRVRMILIHPVGPSFLSIDDTTAGSRQKGRRDGNSLLGAFCAYVCNALRSLPLAANAILPPVCVGARGE
jgi:hypothetical protein